jgi:hypothetical protein
MERAAADRTLPSWAVLLLLVVGAIGVHGSIIGCTFFSDDFEVLWRIRAGEGSSFFRPLSDLSLRLNLALTGPEPWAFRVVNVALLGVNGWLVHLLAKRIRGDAAALLAALLFVVYPFHLEPQAWIIGRGIALASAFTLGALVVASGNAPAAARTSVVALLVLLGTLCYESALLAPVLLGAWWLIRRPVDQAAWRAMVMASSAMVVGNLVLRWFFLAGMANDYGAAFFRKPMSDYFASAAKLVGRSLLPPLEDASAQAVRFGLLGVALLLIALWFWRSNRTNPERLRTAALLVALFGISGIIAVVGGVSTRTSESDRFLYLPSAFLCLAATMVVLSLPNRVVRIVLGAALLAASTVGLARGIRPWREASDMVEGILREVRLHPAAGVTYVVGLPGDVRGAYAFRHGFEQALLWNGLDASRIQRRGPPIAIRRGDERPSYQVMAKPGGALLLTPSDTTSLRPADQVLAWQQGSLRPAWP